MASFLARLSRGVVRCMVRGGGLLGSTCRPALSRGPSHPRTPWSGVVGAGIWLGSSLAVAGCESYKWKEPGTAGRFEKLYQSRAELGSKVGPVVAGEM